MLSSRPDSYHSPPHENPDNPSVSKPEKSPQLPISFNSWEQCRRNMISLSGRCLTTVISLSFLILGLRIFSRMGKLSHMEQRGFNTITILLSAFTSLGLGSVLGHLGSILRWRLLARKKYKMQDIELLLAMQSPTGSAKLLFVHVREWRSSLTTFIVMLYLFTNVTGRFSVAIFGLTYNLVDDSVVDYPTFTTTWTPSVLLAKNATDFDRVEKSLLSYLDLVRGGLVTLGSLPDIRFDSSTPQNINPETLHSFLTGNWFDGETGMVNLTYYLLDFSNEENQEIYGTSSDHAIHSSANCTMLRLEGHKYWRDYNSDDQISYDWKDESNKDTMAEVLRVLDSKNAWPRQGPEQVTWAAPLAGESNGSSVTYVVYHETAWECFSRLFETLEPERGPHPKPLFDSSTIFLLPIVERMERGVSEPTGGLNNSCGGPVVGRAGSIVYRSFADLKSQSSPSVGVQTLNFYQNGTGGSATQQIYYNIYVAGLVARLPMAAIAYGDQIYPHVPKDHNANLTKNVETTLEVKWSRVGIAAGIIVASKILAITAVLYYCRNVYIQEDSYLTTAELLKTVLSRIDHRGTMTAEELGDTLDKVLEGPVSYGTIPGQEGDQPRAALGREVDYSFPGFPPCRKRSLFRRQSGS